MERFAETLARPRDISQVDEENFALSAELFDQRLNVFAHKLEVGLTESDAVDRARHDSKNPAKGLGINQYSPDTSKRR